MTPAIHINQLTKTYADGTQALKGVSFDIAQGDFFALMGANGAGKTTIIGILTGLVNKTSGKVQVFDYDLDRQLADVKRSIGVVPQEFNFNMFEKVQDIVVTQGGYYGIERDRAMADSEEILKKVGLWDKRNTASRSLSGGMKRRLMIARALIHKPRLLILDEPTAGVDVELRYGMWDYLREINRSGTTILLTTHYLEEVEQMCRHAAMIKNGEIIRYDRVSRLLKVMKAETYVIIVKDMKEFAAVKAYKAEAIDEHTIEVELTPADTLNDLLAAFTKDGFTVTDFRPKGHRLEKLFLSLLKE